MRRILNLLLLIFLISIVLPISNTIYAAEEDVYDVILFWGQSNMVGYAGRYDWECQKDTRIEKVGIEKFSEATRINKEILEKSVAVNYVEIGQINGTAFEYIYSNTLNLDGKTRGSLKEINKSTKNIGQLLAYNKNTGLLDTYNKTIHNGYYSLQRSYGTNIVPQFCNQYHKRTGRKIVAVMCSNGGEKISDFLPSTDIDYGEKNQDKPQYIYESMLEKYSEAIKYLENNGYKIGQRLYVVFQGETDVGSKTTQSEYERIFYKVHEYIQRDMGITKGAIIQTARVSGEADRYEYIKQINNAQVNLIKNEISIINGSNFPYKNYIPDKETYELSSYKNDKYTDSAGNKIPYDNALKLSRYSTCYTTLKDENGNSLNDEIHFTSAALSQIGYEVATNFSKVSKITVLSNPIKMKYYIGENLDIKGLKIKPTFVSGATKEVESGFVCTPTKLDKLGTQEITVTYEGKSTKFNVEVLENTISRIEIANEPSKVIYCEGDTLNISGLKIKAIYANGAAKEIESGFVCTPTTLNTIGTQEIIVTYEGKSTKFNVIVQEISLDTNKEGIEIKNNKIYISNREIKETIEKFKNSIITNGNLDIYVGEERVEETQTKVKTGMKIKIRNGIKEKEYIIIVEGDATGDGDVDFYDMLQINKHRLNKIKLEGEYKEAADITKDGYIDFYDILQINKHRLNKI